jgi:hypothetical protein
MNIKRNLAISDSGFLFNPSTGDSYSLNPIAQQIFSLMKEGKSDGDIKARVLEDYNTDASTFEKDFYDFIGLLNNYKLLENE